MSVQGQAPTGQPVPPPAEKKPARRNPILGYIEDSYNGLYKIVIEPSMPTKQTVILLVVGLIIGLIWGYLISPTEFSGANPNRLNQAAQDQWVKSLAVAYDTQTFYDENRTRLLVSTVPDPASAVNRMVNDPATDLADQAALLSLKTITDTIPSEAAAPAVTEPGLGQQLGGLIIPILLVLIVTPILVVVWRLLIYDNLIAPLVQRVREIRDPEIGKKRRAAADDIKRRQEERRLAEELRKKEEEERKKAEAEGRGDAYGAPAMQALYIYNKGRSFDESTEIEVGAAKEFLGQCGAVIAEAVDPDPTAVEVWLFDMFDQVNIKKVIITETAYGNASVRAAVEDTVDNPATDVIVAAPGVVVTLETQKLRLQAKVPTLTTTPDGRFENFNIQMQAWDKSKMNAVVPAPVAPAPLPTMAAPLPIAPAPLPPAPTSRPLSDYDDIQFDPPPLRPAAPPPASRPLSDYDNIQFDPPPLSAPRPAPAPLQPLRPAAPPPAPGFGDEDDPFGNTGDFTPLGNGR